MIPESKSYISHRYTYDKQLRNSGIRSHGLRHAYAQRRYKELTGWNAPIAGGPQPKELNYEQRRKDILARMILTEELGHSRTQILRAYIKMNFYNILINIIILLMLILLFLSRIDACWPAIL